MGPLKVLTKYLGPVPISPPNTQTKHHDVHDPEEWVGVPTNVVGHHKVDGLQSKHIELRNQK
jgi:hypothetical protein